MHEPPGHSEQRQHADPGGGTPDPTSPASGDLRPLIYDQLRRIAQRRMQEQRSDHTLQATALVHEAYARLAEKGVRWGSDAQYFFAAARAMRDILVEHARARGRIKRGGDGSGRSAARAPIDVADLAAVEDDGHQILALEAAVQRLEAEEPDVGAVVRLRFYAGLTGEQAAEALGVSPRQVDRLWAYARARLFRLVQQSDAL